MKKTIGLFAAGLLLASCAATRPEPPPLPFTGTTWQLVMETPLPGPQPYVRFGDGIVRGSGGVLYVSDWKNGRLYAVDRQGKVSTVKDGFQAAADIGISADKRYLVVPDMKAGAVLWLPMP